MRQLLPVPISLHPIIQEKTKIPLKKVHIKLHSESPFLEHNNLFRINFSRMYYFQFLISLSKMGFWFFFSRFLYPKHKNLFRIYFFGMHYFHFQNKGYFWNFEIMLGAGSVGCKFKSVGCKKHLPIYEDMAQLSMPRWEWLNLGPVHQTLVELCRVFLPPPQQMAFCTS